MEIDGSGTRDVTVYSPMTVKGSLSTFENNLFIGSQQPTTANNITTVGSVLIGNKLRVQGAGGIETYKLKTIGSTLTDGVEIVNVEIIIW